MYILLHFKKSLLSFCCIAEKLSFISILERIRALRPFGSCWILWEPCFVKAKTTIDILERMKMIFEDRKLSTESYMSWICTDQGKALSYALYVFDVHIILFLTS